MKDLIALASFALPVLTMPSLDLRITANLGIRLEVGHDIDHLPPEAAETMAVLPEVERLWSA